LLRTAIYVSEQVCIGWHRTGAYYIVKLTFFTIFLQKFRSRITKVCILYSNFYAILKQNAKHQHIVVLTALQTVIKVQLSTFTLTVFLQNLRYLYSGISILILYDNCH